MKLMAREKVITYQDVFEANRLFETLPNTFNREWLHVKKFVDWQNLHELTDKEIMRRVVNFLNQWSSHIKKTPEVVIGIKEAHRDSLSYLKMIQAETLWDLNLEKKMIINNNEFKLGEILHHIFKRYRDIGYHLREVASSKILHHINPNVFIMWDNRIIRAYNVKRTSADYVYDFLPLMKEKTNQVIESYVRDYKLDRDEAINKLNSYREHKTLVKLIDEYNWITYTYFGKK